MDLENKNKMRRKIKSTRFYLILTKQKTQTLRISEVIDW